MPSLKLGWREQVDKDRVKAGLGNVEVEDKTEWRDGVKSFHQTYQR